MEKLPATEYGINVSRQTTRRKVDPSKLECRAIGFRRQHKTGTRARHRLDRLSTGRTVRRSVEPAISAFEPVGTHCLPQGAHTGFRTTARLAAVLSPVPYLEQQSSGNRAARQRTSPRAANSEKIGSVSAPGSKPTDAGDID